MRFISYPKNVFQHIVYVQCANVRVHKLMSTNNPPGGTDSDSERFSPSVCVCMGRWVDVYVFAPSLCDRTSVDTTLHWLHNIDTLPAGPNVCKFTPLILSAIPIYHTHSHVNAFNLCACHPRNSGRHDSGRHKRSAEQCRSVCPFCSRRTECDRRPVRFAGPRFAKCVGGFAPLAAAQIAYESCNAT